MRIRLAFTDDDCDADQMPYLVAAVDEFTEDEWGGIPDFYKDDVAKHKNVREVNVYVRDEDVRNLFSVPTVKVRLEGSEP